MQDKTAVTGLKKSFGLKMAIIIVISAIVGSGVFKKAAPMAALLHTPGLVVLAWLLAGIIILFGILSIAELSALFPSSGGPFLWLEKIYGKPLSFFYGWSCFTVIQTAAIASVAFVFAGALDTFFALPHLSVAAESIHFLGLYPLKNIGAKIAAALLIITLTLVNIKGARNGGNVSLLFTLLILVAIIAIVFIAFFGGMGSTATLQLATADLPESGYTVFGFISAMVLAMRAAFWGYEGWIALGFIGDEINESRKNLPRALIAGICIVILVYLLVNSAYFFVMPVDEMIAGVQQNENSIAAVLVVDKMLGDGGAYIISAMILVSTFGCTNATILVSARIYYAMACKGLFFKKAALTHPNNKTPHYALTYQCIWACLLVFSGSFDFLTDLVVISGFIFFGLIVWGVVRLRKKMKDAARSFKTPLYPLIPVVFVLFCILLIVISFIESPYKSLTGLGLILSGMPFYWYWNGKLRKRKPRRITE
ncbi:MAG: amino acid permease [Taibaiella sp.]|nr:amino acid permease [Taibaiella sp.]